ncbi:MAG: FHA domain-containing protein [Acidobacteriota bacterium]
MHVILQGSFSHFGAEQLLTLISSHQHSGTLEVIGDRDTARLYFLDGEAVYATGPFGSTGETLVADLFAWDDGSFTFSDDSTLPAGVESAAINLESAFTEGKQRADEWRGLLRFYPNDQLRLRVVADPRTDGAINLTTDEFKLLMKIGQGMSLSRLREDLQRPVLELYRTLQRLEEGGLLERLPLTEEPETSTAEPEPSTDLETHTPPPFESSPSEDWIVPPPAEDAPESDANAQPEPVYPPEPSPVSDLMNPAFAGTLDPSPAFIPSPEPQFDGGATMMLDSPPPQEAPAASHWALPDAPTASRMGTLQMPFAELKTMSGVPASGVLISSSGSRILLTENAYSIGRSTGQDIPITDISVSSKHARISRTFEGFVLEDLNSRNGTFVNGERISEPRVISEGDVVGFGKVVFTFSLAPREGVSPAYS